MRNQLTLAAQGAPRIRVRSERASDYTVALICVIGITGVFLVGNSNLFHWFVLALIPSGILAGVDVVSWARGKMEVFDPKALLGIVCFHGFFLAPLLSVAWDHVGIAFGGYTLFRFESDPRTWFGVTALLNAAGLVAFRLAHNRIYRRTQSVRSTWTIHEVRFAPVMIVGILMGVTALAYLLNRLGGIGGITETFAMLDPTAFRGLGWLQAFSWCISILLTIVCMVFVEGPMHLGGRVKYTMVMLLLAMLAAVHFIVQGFYGSRSSLIWAAFWMVGIVHYRVVRLSKKTVIGGAFLALTLMYFYGFYKERGRQAVEVIMNPNLWLDPVGYRRDARGLVIGDLARFDTEAFILHNLLLYPGEYRFRLGATYLSGPIQLVPTALWPTKPQIRAEAGTSALYGRVIDNFSSLVYGLPTEAMLNFSPLGIPLVFAFYGAVFGWYRRKIRSIPSKDSRNFLLPYLTILFIVGFIGDSENVFVAASLRGGFAVACVWLASRRTPVGEAISAGPGRPRMEPQNGLTAA